MQLDIIFKNERIELPIATSACVQGLLYNALRQDSQYSESLHENGETFDNRKFKLFSFSELKGKYVIEDKKIIFLSQAQLTVRSADPYCIQLLFSYFNSRKTVFLAEQDVEIGELKIRDNHIFSDEITVETLSPITVYITNEDGHTQYYSPKEKEFYNSIIHNAYRKWKSFYGNDNNFSLEISPHPDAKFKKCATSFKKTFITAWHGKFILKAPPQVLDFLYQTGLGSKNSQGFGMFETTDKINYKNN